MIRRAPILLVAALLAAIHLNCNATVGIWLRSGERTRDYLRRTCVDFPGSDGVSLDQLKPLLADVVLSTTSSEAIWVEVQIWGPWSLAEDGCVDPGDLDGSAGALPEIIVWGESEPIDLSDSTREIEVLLDCVTVDLPGIPDTCDERCMGWEESCFARVGAWPTPPRTAPASSGSWTAAAVVKRAMLAGRPA